MKKFIAGVVVGAVMATAVTAGAAALAPIGKKIDSSYKVTVDGKALNNLAIVVEGKSYIPTTDVGAATGKKVSFSSKEGIVLTSTPEAVTTAEPVESAIPEVVLPSVDPGKSSAPTPNPINVITTKIDKVRIQIESYKNLLYYAKTDAQKTEYQLKLDDLTAELADLQAQLAALQSPSPTPAP